VCWAWGPFGTLLKEQGSYNPAQNRGHKGPVLRPRCIGPGEGPYPNYYSTLVPVLYFEIIKGGILEVAFTDRELVWAVENCQSLGQNLFCKRKSKSCFIFQICQATGSFDCKR
jgi:hypothetical protein